MIKKIIPYQIKVRLHLLRNIINDILNGYYFNYAQNRKSLNDFSNTFIIKQELKPNNEKRNNLLIAIKKIESIEIYPNEIFSFWRIVGNPTLKNGYKESRSLVNGNIENTIGGGLCQLSGLIYYISLSVGLEVLERHSHSTDIYTNETRFTPLGSDATVVYGYKDLKIKNNLKSPVKFMFSMDKKFITIKLMHSSLIEGNVVEFKKTVIENNTTEVITYVNSEEKIRSVYKIYQ